MRKASEPFKLYDVSYTHATSLYQVQERRAGHMALGGPGAGATSAMPGAARRGQYRPTGAPGLRQYIPRKCSHTHITDQSALLHIALGAQRDGEAEGANQATQRSSKSWRPWSKRDIAFIHDLSAHGVRDPHGARCANGWPLSEVLRSSGMTLFGLGFAVACAPEVPSCRRGISWLSMRMLKPANDATRAGMRATDGDPSSPAAMPPATAHQTSSVLRATWQNALPPENPALVPPHRCADRSPTVSAALGCRESRSGAAEQPNAIGPTIAKLSPVLRTASLYVWACSEDEIFACVMA